MACLPPPEHARLRLEVNFYSEAFMLSSTFWTFLHGHFATKLRFQSYILLVKMPDDDAWGRYKTILETLKFETVWFILVLFYVMVVFSVVVPIASRFNYQVDMLLLLINHPCGVAWCSLVPASIHYRPDRDSYRDAIQRWRIYRRCVLRTQCCREPQTNTMKRIY